MPYKSKKQHRYFRYLESQGELPKGTSDEWMNETKNYKKLPEKKASMDMNKRYINLLKRRGDFEDLKKFEKSLTCKKASFYKRLINKIAVSRLIPSGPPLKPIDNQKERLDSINEKKRMGMSPVEYRNTRKNRY